MGNAYYSSSWYRAAKLKPRIRSHAKVIRQQFRGETWFVLQDPLSGRYHRFSPAAHLVMNLMDGRRNVQEIWDLASIELGDDLLTQDEMLRLLAQLHAADLLQVDEMPDIEEVARRGDKVDSRKLLMRFLNPLAVRIPVLDPDAFLSETMFLARPFISWFGALIYVLVVGIALVQAAVHWETLTADIVDRVLAAQSLVILALTYPFVKAIHELGHGYVVKKWGGEVHELGLMFLVFVPVPYVEASAATAFRSKWRRALVGAAGILVESFLAAVAFFVWLSVEPGLVRAFAFNVMLIGGVSTVLFNGNPLLRFDGYYVLSDVLEIPNLGQRSTRYLGYLVQRYVFGIRDCTSPATAGSERKWLFSYAIGSFCYRIVIMSAIIMFVATKFFVVGVILAAWGVVLMLGLPLFKGLKFLFTSPALKGKRFRTYASCVTFIAVIATPLLFFPVPYRAIAEGVVMPAEGSAVYAGATGRIMEIEVPSIARVKRGDVLARMEDPFLEWRVRIVQAEVKEYRLRYEAAVVADRIGAKIHKERLRRAESELAQLLDRQAQLEVSSPRDGVFIMPTAVDMPGRFLSKGSLIGFVIDPEITSILTVVREDDADLVRQRLRTVEIRRISDLDMAVPASVVRELPAISDKLPSLALSTEGGGSFVLDPERAKEGKSLEGLLQIEVSPLEQLDITDLGGRVLVRFDLEPQPLARRLYRSLRQLLLEKFNV